MDSARTLTLAEAHAFLGVSEKTLRNWCKAQRVPYHRVRNERGVLEYRFKAQDLEAFQRGKAGKTDHHYGRQPSENIAVAAESQEILPDPEAPHPANDAGQASARRESAGNYYRDALLAHLRDENAFLKAQLIERDRQLTTKDRQLEKQLERINNLNEALTSLAQHMLSK